MSKIFVSGKELGQETVTAGQRMQEKRSLTSFVGELARRIPMSTGLIPQNLVSIRQGGDFLQLLIVMPPAINPIIWGARERAEAKTWHLAQPYRVIIGEFQKDQFLGARMFYSPENIISFEQPLYHMNVPNINCKGYRGTGVGWVCLYQTVDTTKMNIAEKASYLGMKVSGGEAYNDVNMSQTDGARYYQALRDKQSHLWDAKAWEKMSDKKGWQWTLDRELWLPIKVTGIDSQLQQDDSGVQLTLRMAMTGNAPFYYNDKAFPRPYNVMERGDVDGEVRSSRLEEASSTIISSAFTKAAVVKTFSAIEDEQPTASPAKKGT